MTKFFEYLKRSYFLLESMDGEKICCGIVTYNPDPSLFKRVIDAVENQVKRIYIWDNGSKNIDFIKCLCHDCNITLLSSHKNKGIAYGLNRICEKAKQDGFSWILTLDHDTIISLDYIRNIEFYKESQLGIICPDVEYVGMTINKKNNSNRFINVEACMTSGSIMSLQAWENVGKFEEWLFIDSVDNDICYKLRLNGYLVIRDTKFSILHNLGKPICKKKLFFSYIDYQYPAFRIYYIVRNRIYISFKYWRLNTLRFIGASLKILFYTYLSVYDDKDKLRSFNKGIKDGFCKILSLNKS